MILEKTGVIRSTVMSQGSLCTSKNQVVIDNLLKMNKFDRKPFRSAVTLHGSSFVCHY